MGQARRRRRRRQRRKKDRKAVGAKDARSFHDVPDDLLRLILLRLDSPIWLIRAACACKRWRRVVTDGADQGRAFLRHASSLHPPAVAGQYHNKTRGYIRFVPSSSLPIQGSRHFSIDFLNKINSRSQWHVADCHGGLVLLRTNFGPPCSRSVADLMVYDPLAHQLRPISHPPPPPMEEVYSYGGSKGTFLFGGDDGNISILNFRVLYRLSTGAAGPQACVFSTANNNGAGEWDWRILISGSADQDIFRHRYAYMAGRADGSLYLGLMMTYGLGSRIVALDNTSLVLSRVDLPSRLLEDKAGFSSSTFTLVHAAGMSSIVHVRGEELELFRQVHGSGEWVLEHSIPNLSSVAVTRGLSICLEKNCMEWMTMVAVVADGAASAILSACSLLDKYTNTDRWFFCFDVNTMDLRVLPKELYGDTRKIFNYALPWPQFLQACPCS